MKGSEVFLLGVLVIAVCVFMAVVKLLIQIGWWMPWALALGVSLCVWGDRLSRRG